MASLENISLIMSLVGIALSIIFSVIAYIDRQQVASADKRTESRGASPKRSVMTVAATIMLVVSVLFITLAIITRIIQTGHGPFSNMYEFSIAFAWGIIVFGLIFRWRYKTGAVLNICLIVTLLLLIFARIEFSRPTPLVPALQQSALLSAHVSSAVVAYGTLTVSFGAAVLYLIRNSRKAPWLPELEVLDTISYRAVMIGFPFLTLLIVLGALWADVAWGRYWGWDPKETASLVTWLIYVAYMHARIMRGWQGTRASILLVAGFAAILVTFFGNYIFSGLHTYA
jgi:cytochrome c-type biogenesis protein CcsB